MSPTAQTEAVQAFLTRIRPANGQCRIPTPEDTEEVIVVGSSYHDPDELPLGVSGEYCPEFAAFYDRGAVPCSDCFAEQSPVAYPYGYLDPETERTPTHPE